MPRLTKAQKAEQNEKSISQATDFFINRSHQLYLRNGKIDNKVPRLMPIKEVQFIIKDIFREVQAQIKNGGIKLRA